MRVAPTIAPVADNSHLYRTTYCTAIMGKLGKSTGLGRFQLGLSGVGDRQKIRGIYQRRKLSTDRTRYDPNTNPEHPFIVMRSYRPTYFTDAETENNRAGFRAAVAFWQSLTDEEKSIYNKRGAKSNLSGYNVAISDFMRRYREA